MADKKQEIGTDGQVPEAQVDARLNLVPPGYQVRYKPNGKHVLIPDEDVAEWEFENGLITEKYDLEAAVAEWHAAWEALGDAVGKSMDEMAAAGYQRDESIWVMNEANGRYVGAWQFLARCVGALIPTEGQVRSVAEHAALHGDLTAVPSLQKFAPLAEQYAAENPVSVEAVKDAIASHEAYVASQKEAAGETE